MTVYADLFRYRELFTNLFRRDFHAKYKGSLLGVAWSLLNPLVLLGVYLVVFGVLIKKVRFPRQLVALSMVATQAVTYALMIAILIVLSLVFVPEARGHVSMSVPLAALFVGFVAGLALLVACLNVLFRDVEHILTAALLPWFFLTPILWSVDSLPASARSHHALLDVLRWGNPVAPPIFAVRDALWSGHAPRVADVVYLAVASVVALLLGALVFRAVDDRIAVEL